MIKASENMKLYKESSFDHKDGKKERKVPQETIESIVQPERPLENPLRLPNQDDCKEMFHKNRELLNLGDNIRFEFKEKNVSIAQVSKNFYTLLLSLALSALSMQIKCLKIPLPNYNGASPQFYVRKDSIKFLLS